MNFVTARIGSDPLEHRRHYVNQRSHLSLGERNLAVWTVDLSGSGARIALGGSGHEGFEGEGWHLTVPGIGRFPVRRRWRRGSTCGLEFELSADERRHLAEDLGRRFGPG